jgi:hypothetical protein
MEIWRDVEKWMEFADDDIQWRNSVFSDVETSHFLTRGHF